MINEDISQKDFNVAIKVGKVSGNALLKAIKMVLSKLRNVKTASVSDNARHGRTTLKQLQKRGEGLSTFELTQPDLRLLNRIMKKHGVSFAAARDGKGKYTLFFKGKDIDSVKHAFDRYAKKMVRSGRGKPSIQVALSKAKDTAQALNAERSKEKNRSRGALDR